MSRPPAARTRLGTGTAALAIVALTGVATPAQAAESKPDLSVSFDRDPVAAVDNSGATVGLYVYNNGDAPATGVTVTLDTAEVGEAVTVSVPEWADGCTLTGTKVTCAVGHLDAGQVTDLHPLELASRQGAEPGPAGQVTVTIAGAEEDANPADNTTTFPVMVIASGPDLVAAADDLSTKDRPVGPGDTAPLRAAIINEGDSPATNFSFTFSLPAGAIVVERYSDCTYTDYWPKAVKGKGYAYGPSEVSCVLPLTVEPGNALLLFDEESGKPAFTASFGKNLSGPEEHHASFSTALAEELRAAKSLESTKGTGPSLAEKLEKATSIQAKRVAEQELDESDNYADMSFWSKKNTLDVAVKVPAVKGAIGQTVDLKYEVVNNGPSDGGGPGVDITAPSGTVLLPAEWCYTAGTENETRPESKKLHCNFESIFPTVYSGTGRLTPTVKLKITSAPGTDGTVVAASGGVASKESKPANNTARIVITTAGTGTGGSGGEGGGGGLPITGPSTGTLAGLGAAAIAIGATLVVAFRRRRPD